MSEATIERCVIESCQKGDREAFRLLFEEQVPSLAGLARTSALLEGFGEPEQRGGISAIQVACALKRQQGFARAAHFQQYGT